MEVLSTDLRGDTLHFSVQMGKWTVTSLVRNVGEDLVNRRLVRRIHTNNGFYKGLRWAFDEIIINQLRLALNEKLAEGN